MPKADVNDYSEESRQKKLTEVFGAGREYQFWDKSVLPLPLTDNMVHSVMYASTMDKIGEMNGVAISVLDAVPQTVSYTASQLLQR